MDEGIARGGGTPRFYVTPRQPMRAWVVVLAGLMAAGALFGVQEALRHAGSAGGRGSHGRRGAGAGEDEDPYSVETIYVGDPGEAPVATAGEAKRVRSVHPFRVVKLPRSGEQVGRIPDTPAGRLLYAWMAAFNKADAAGLTAALPNAAPAGVTAAEMEIRRETGGLRLLSASEVEPGVLVFRMEDQTPLDTEVLGTLQVREGSSPPAVGSFSLRAVPRSAAQQGRASGSPEG